MNPPIFPINGCLATSARILSENRPTYCSASNCRTHRQDPAARCLLFSCFLEGPVLAPSEIQGSQEHSQPLRSHSGPSWGRAHHLQGLLRQPGCTTEVRELHSHFKQRCSESHRATPPTDFNRCPTSFKRDHYQSRTTPVVTMLKNLNLLLYEGVAPAEQSSLSITDLLMRLYLLTVPIRLCSRGAHREVPSFCSYPSETRLTESNPLPHKNCMLFWKSKCK